MNEKELVEERDINFVKKIFTHFNLGASKFEELWKDWWEKEKFYYGIEQTVGE